MQLRFLLQILLLAQHVSGTTMPTIRSSRVLYSGCCLWYFVLWFASCWSGVELRVMCPVCRMLQHPANRTHNSAFVGVTWVINFIKLHGINNIKVKTNNIGLSGWWWWWWRLWCDYNDTLFTFWQSVIIWRTPEFYRQYWQEWQLILGLEIVHDDIHKKKYRLQLLFG